MNGKCSKERALGSQTTKLYHWDFNVFELEKSTGGRPLSVLTMAMFEEQELLDGWRLNREAVKRYLAAVEGIYKRNPYHNNTHAADVTQTAGVIMRSMDEFLRTHPAHGGCSTSGRFCPHCGTIPSDSGTGCSTSGVWGGLTKLERFAIILASAVHDLGHPGVNNAFLVKTRDKQAIIYNDRSVNENMHAALAFQLAQEHPSQDIFANFSQAEYEHVRKLVVDMVLSTDMDVHFKLLHKFQKQLAVEPDVRLWTSLQQRSLLFQMLVHLADLANPSRPWPLALTWAEMVVTEFFGQGSLELAANIPVSPPCDKTKACMPNAQLGFIENFMAPTLELMRSAAPSFYFMASAWLTDTQAKWKEFRDAGVRFPKEGYPQLPAMASAQQSKLWTVLGDGAQSCVACSASEQQLMMPCQVAGSPLQQSAQQQAAQAAG